MMKSQVRVYWKDFKRILEGLRQKSEQAYNDGRNISLPSWYVDLVDISFERARESAQRITNYALRQDEDYLAKSLPPSERSLASAGVNTTRWSIRVSKWGIKWQFRR